MGEDEIRKIYEVITLDVSKYPLENQLFAIRSINVLKQIIVFMLKDI